jgi:hypothetical protein
VQAKREIWNRRVGQRCNITLQTGPGPEQKDVAKSDRARKQESQWGQVAHADDPTTWEPKAGRA